PGSAQVVGRRAGSAVPLVPHRGAAHRPGALRHRGARTASGRRGRDRKSTRLNSSHGSISYAVFCLKKKKRRKKEIVSRKRQKIKSRRSVGIHERKKEEMRGC